MSLFTPVAGLTGGALIGKSLRTMVAFFSSVISSKISLTVSLPMETFVFITLDDP